MSNKPPRKPSATTKDTTMNKMIKGAAITTVGVALLLGGGGTLAVWNASQEANAGQIVSGDLNLQAAAGVWTSDLTNGSIDVATYRVVPGETLTYTQQLTVDLDGDALEATLTVTGASANNGFKTDNVQVGTTTLKANDEPIANVLDETSPATVIATTQFKFLESTTGRDSVNAAYDFQQIGYKLEQIAPSSN